MKPQEVVRERAEAAASQLQEVFSAFVIIGLPLDEKDAPMIVSSGDEDTIRDLITAAQNRRIDEDSEHSQG